MQVSKINKSTIQLLLCSAAYLWPSCPLLCPVPYPRYAGGGGGARHLPDMLKQVIGLARKHREGRGHAVQCTQAGAGAEAGRRVRAGHHVVRLQRYRVGVETGRRGGDDGAGWGRGGTEGEGSKKGMQ